MVRPARDDKTDPQTAGPLAQRRAVVTGSSRGIGQAIALELAGAGASIVVHAGHDDAAAAATARLVEDRGVRAEFTTADLSQRSERDKFFAEATRHGIPDIWVNNAGVDVLTGHAADWSFDEKLEALWRVDVAATIDLSRKIGVAMKQRGAGVILNMGWDQADTGMEGDSGEMFAAVKGAVASFTKSLARSLAPEVRVHCLAPGWIRTAWGEQASASWQRRAIEESLLGRWGTPEDVAKTAAFLASPAAQFLTGLVVPINGGAAR